MKRRSWGLMTMKMLLRISKPLCVSLAASTPRLPLMLEPWKQCCITSGNQVKGPWLGISTQSSLFSNFSVWLIKTMSWIRGPWALDGHILSLKQMTGMEIPSEVEFINAWFWVKAYDIPGKQQTISFARLLASNIRTLVDCDEGTLYGIDKALCFQLT